MIFLKASDTEVYMRGAREILQDNESRLSPDRIDIIIQEYRRNLVGMQDRIAKWERIRMDAVIREEQEKRRKQTTETRLDDRGRPYQVVYAE